MDAASCRKREDDGDLADDDYQCLPDLVDPLEEDLGPERPESEQPPAGQAGGGGAPAPEIVFPQGSEHDPSGKWRRGPNCP
eukprot:1271534-Alexandrium_andersonii.AAC.1